MHAKEAELAEFGDELFGQCSRFKPVRDVRHDPVGSELAYGVADEALVVAQFIVDLEQVAADGLCGARHGSVLSAPGPPHGDFWARAGARVFPAARVSGKPASAQPRVAGGWSGTGLIVPCCGPGVRAMPGLAPLCHLPLGARSGGGPPAATRVRNNVFMSY